MKKVTSTLVSGYGGHGPMDSMAVSGMSPLTMMSMHEQYPWMKEKKASRKQMQGKNDGDQRY